MYFYCQTLIPCNTDTVSTVDLIRKAHLNLYHVFLIPHRCIFTLHCSLYTKKVEMKRKVNCKVNSFQSIPTQHTYVTFLFATHAFKPQGELLFSEKFQGRTLSNYRDKVWRSQGRQSITTKFIIGASGVSLSRKRRMGCQPLGITITSNQPTTFYSKRVPNGISLTLFIWTAEKTSVDVLHTVSLFIIQTTKQRGCIVFCALYLEATYYSVICGKKPSLEYRSKYNTSMIEQTNTVSCSEKLNRKERL